MEDIIKLQHGNGGKPTGRLIQEVFYRSFSNELLLQGFDSALLELKESRLAFTTDSFIIKPHFFPGGDIGKLAVCGTVNDLAVCGARPLYLSCAMIIEEGFQVQDLKRIADSMAFAAKEVGVKIVTGDTKVVEKGNGDGIYINTSGIGACMEGYQPKKPKQGDAVIVSGEIGEHGAVVALHRFAIDFCAELQSDCASLLNIVQHLQPYFNHIKLMKDPTRGGVATVLNEITSASQLGACLYGGKIPVKQETEAICRMLGMEPLYLACEGRLLLVVEGSKAEEVLQHMKQLECCKNAEIIGCLDESYQNLVYIDNGLGGKRLLPALEGDLLPRIC